MTSVCDSYICNITVSQQIIKQKSSSSHLWILVVNDTLIGFPYHHHPWQWTTVVIRACIAESSDVSAVRPHRSMGGNEKKIFIIELWLVIDLFWKLFPHAKRKTLSFIKSKVRRSNILWKKFLWFPWYFSQVNKPGICSSIDFLVAGVQNFRKVNKIFILWKMKNDWKREIDYDNEIRTFFAYFSSGIQISQK